MLIQDIRYDFISGAVSECRIMWDGNSCSLSAYYETDNKWVTLSRKRRGVRLFDSVERAMIVAAEIGFNCVTLLQKH